MRIQINTPLAISTGLELTDLVVIDKAPYFNQLSSLKVLVEIGFYISETAITEKCDSVHVVIGGEKLTNVVLSVTISEAQSPALLGAAYNDYFKAAILEALALTEEDITVIEPID